METDLQPAKNVLQSFLAEIEFAKRTDPYWEKENAYAWLYAETRHFRSLMHQPKINQSAE